MDFAAHYFSRQKSFVPLIQEVPEKSLQQVIVIPATREKELLSSVWSFCACTRPSHPVEILVLINESEHAGEEDREINRAAYREMEALSLEMPVDWIKLYPLFLDGIPEKIAGVGNARKLGMDQALWRFRQLGIPEGLIVSFDADAVCDPDYLLALENQMKRMPQTRGLSIYFEHDLSPNRNDALQRVAIISYETHLRAYKLALQQAGFPYSFHTVGSSFAVSASTYAMQGGMNRNKAGEDFYFLQKIIPLGNFHELNDTRILLSPRISNRVPFGTGAAMQKMLREGESQFLTYHPEAFHDMEMLFRSAAAYFGRSPEETDRKMKELPAPLLQFLLMNGFGEALAEMNRNASGENTFLKRFYQWFNAFRVLKYLNYSHTAHYRKIQASEAGKQILDRAGIRYINQPTDEQILLELRRYEREETTQA